MEVWLRTLHMYMVNVQYLTAETPHIVRACAKSWSTTPFLCTGQDNGHHGPTQRGKVIALDSCCVCAFAAQLPAFCMTMHDA